MSEFHAAPHRHCAAWVGSYSLCVGLGPAHWVTELSVVPVETYGLVIGEVGDCRARQPSSSVTYHRTPSFGDFAVRRIANRPMAAITNCDRANSASFCRVPSVKP